MASRRRRLSRAPPAGDAWFSNDSLNSQLVFLHVLHVLYVIYKAPSGLCRCREHNAVVAVVFNLQTGSYAARLYCCTYHAGICQHPISPFQRPGPALRDSGACMPVD